VRERTRAAIGAFDAGNPKWYPWLSENLLKYGAEFDTSELLRSFLGHPLSADVLVSTIAAIRQPK
jgi:Zn-dependent M32 family carboxypeptidase